MSVSGGVGERQDRVKVISLWENKCEGLLKTRGMAWLGALVAKGWESGISVPNFPSPLRELCPVKADI